VEASAVLTALSVEIVAGFHTEVSAAADSAAVAAAFVEAEDSAEVAAGAAAVDAAGNRTEYPQ
jgi:hypothetical protein